MCKQFVSITVAMRIIEKPANF